MCGIFGVTEFTTERLDQARSALETLTDRGPDQGFDFHDETVYSGHRRLSILDLSEKGSQPMISANGNIILTINGEIYNYKKLKKELQKKYTFRSSSDSEVLLHGYDAWGIEQLLQRIEGMFAFSIYDKSIGKVFLARDRVGIKPLYYSRLNAELAWASELKALEHFYRNELVVDHTAIYDYLTYLYIPTPKTLYKNIYKLPPANYLEINIHKKTLDQKSYWKLKVGNSNDSIDEAAKKISNLISESVKDQLMSDVPLGFFLSGGLDSSAVVAAAAAHSADIHTFSIGFTGSENNEIHYAELIAEKFKTRHQTRFLDLNKTISLYKNIKTWYDEPFADTSCYPTFLVSQFTREKATVALTGDGGDEIFGGYLWYKNFLKYSHVKLPYPLPLRRLFFLLKTRKGITGKIGRYLETRFFIQELELYTRLMGGMLKHEKAKYRRKWNIPEDYDDYWYFRKYYKPEHDIYTRLQYLDFHTYLHDDILTKVDRVSMANSLECRVPLLYTPLIEYMFTLPPDIRLYKNELKGAIKYSQVNKLPEEILNRKKKGFSIPFQAWKNDLFAQDYYRQEYILNDLFPNETNTG